MSEITLSLISHTNVGKTTLARTLLRRDVGEVLDQAHVTEKSEAHLLIEVEGSRLLLWDTPGFGDTARLLKRLRNERNPLGWFLHQVWDRAADRPLWCSQEAARNVQEDADIVLYLVNATEDPRTAGYVDLELELLGWLGKPTLVLLNQVGDDAAAGEALERWRSGLAPRELVHGVLSLDAFARAWVQEGRLLETIVPLLPSGKREDMERLCAAWKRRNLEVFEASMQAVGDHLARAARDREPLPSGAPRSAKRDAMEALTRRLEEATGQLWDGVITAHGLEGGLAAALKGELDDFVIQGEDLFSPKKGAMIGGAVSGAVGGLMADLLSGGLSLGGGLLAGTILGALGGAGLSKAIRSIQGDEEPRVGWSAEFLEALLQQSLLRYVAVAHFGRGRGELSDASHAEGWRETIQDKVRATRRSRAGAWERAAGRVDHDDLAAELARNCERLARELLSEAYPGSFEAASGTAQRALSSKEEAP